LSVRLYMDHHVPGAVTGSLRGRDVFVITAEEDGRRALADPLLLDRAAELGCSLVSQDEDLLAEATRRQRAGIVFSGVIYSHQLRITIGQLVRDLELIAKVYDPGDLENRVERLPF
jgi:hypothetical protein